VIKLNATVGASYGRDIAAFLGSAQLNASIEARALKGEFLLLYVTPEKLACGFSSRLSQLHETKGIALVAIDEAHCVSEWGHDFRPDYRKLQATRDALPGVPFMALTATAVPHVQADILKALSLQRPYVARGTFDRPNLAINIKRKAPSGGAAKSLEGLINSLKMPSAARSSTIVYCATTREVEDVATIMRERCEV